MPEQSYPNKRDTYSTDNWAVGDAAQTESVLEKAIRREPTLESSYRMLARVDRDRSGGLCR